MNKGIIIKLSTLIILAKKADKKLIYLTTTVHRLHARKVLFSLPNFNNPQII